MCICFKENKGSKCANGHRIRLPRRYCLIDKNKVKLDSKEMDLAEMPKDGLSYIVMCQDCKELIKINIIESNKVAFNS